MTKAIYAGTFDPVHLGHIDIITRANSLFDELVVGVGVNPDKNPWFDVDERVSMLIDSLKILRKPRVMPFDGLLVDFAKKLDCSVIVRGIRTTQDMESEFQMALTNKQLSPDIETFFMCADERHTTFSSTLVKQISRFSKGVQLEVNLKKFVPINVIEKILDRIRI